MMTTESKHLAEAIRGLRTHKDWPIFVAEVRKMQALIAVGAYKCDTAQIPKDVGVCKGLDMAINLAEFLEGTYR